MINNTLSIPDLVSTTEIEFLKQMNELDRPLMNSGIFQKMPIADGTGSSRTFSEIELELYASLKPEGAQAKLGRTQQGYSKTGTIKRIAFAVEISYELRHQDKYGEMMRVISSIPSRCVNRIELDMAHVFGFCLSTSYTAKDGELIDLTVGDGLALVSTAHTLTGSSTTYRNRVATNPQLSEGALELAERTGVENSYNNFGEKIGHGYNTLLVTDDPSLVNEAYRLMNSTAQVTAPNAGVVNQQRQKYTVVSSPHIATDANGAPDSTKSKYWFLINAGEWNGFYAENEAPHIKSPQGEGTASENQATDTVRFDTRAGYFIVAVSGRHLMFSSGDGAA